MAGIFDLSATDAAKKARFCERVGIDFEQARPDAHVDAARECLAESAIMECVDWKDEYAEELTVTDAGAHGD